MNQVNIIGNLGAKPELRYIPGGDAVCEMRVATTERWRSNGEKREHTEWHRVILWGAMGENAARYLDKGSKVRVTGRLRTRQWEDREGVKRSTTEIRADEVEYLTAARHSDQPAADDGQSDGYGAESDGAQDDDIPFSEGGAPAEVEAPREVTQRAAAPAPAQRGSGASAPAAGRAPAKSAASNRAPAKRAPRGR